MSTSEPQSKTTSTSIADRPLPVNLDAERFVLGSILLDDAQYIQAAEKLQSDDFSLEKHRRIFKRMAGLYERGERIDRVTLANELTRHRELESVDGLSYLASLDDGLPHIPNLDSYIRIIKEKARLRRLITMSMKAAQRASMAEDTSADVIEELSAQLLEIADPGTSEAMTAVQIITNYPGGIAEFVDPSKAAPGLSTGFHKFDDMTGGLHKSELTVLAARPSMGKSSMMLNIISHVTQKLHKRVVLFSLEDSREACLQRMICAHSRIDAQKYRLGYLNKVEREKWNQGMQRFIESPLLIDDSAPLAVMDIRARLTKIIRKHGPVDLVAIDYLQLLASKGKSENRTVEVGAMSRGLKLMAKELQMPFLVLSQLSRAVEQRKDDHRPRLSDLRESGSIEQDADVVSFIFRPEVYATTNRTDLQGIAELIVAKQRHGPIGTVELVWLGGITRFENRAEEDTEQPLFDHGE